ncbi:uncharacterized protein LOC132875638 isoform X2 [Neoarius graeffei]|uniref:uncharacterized protein LOC132875638 isoform X2 n=1 Tax=Neoarius graeffei TaxID=443677 RepID=UPI00298D11FC|nr:uncharacterized protein LOC132875638 isoform X2 [Neoarius graeffei]
MGGTASSQDDPTNEENPTSLQITMNSSSAEILPQPEEQGDSRKDVKTAITAKIRAIPKEECIKVIQNFARRVQVCLQRNGGHLEHILGKP